jgi:hypothetical protein
MELRIALRIPYIVATIIDSINGLDTNPIQTQYITLSPPLYPCLPPPCRPNSHTLSLLPVLTLPRAAPPPLHPPPTFSHPSVLLRAALSRFKPTTAALSMQTLPAVPPEAPLYGAAEVVTLSVLGPFPAVFSADRFSSRMTRRTATWAKDTALRP